MIYFIQDQATLAIKIGFTEGDPGDRLRALQTGCPGGLVLLAAYAGDQDAEKSLHNRFAAHRERGEWFRPAPALIVELLAQARFASYYSGLADGIEMERTCGANANRNPHA